MVKTTNLIDGDNPFAGDMVVSFNTYKLNSYGEYMGRSHSILSIMDTYAINEETGVYVPPTCVKVGGIEAIRRLRDFLNECLEVSGV